MLINAHALLIVLICIKREVSCMILHSYCAIKPMQQIYLGGTRSNGVQHEAAQITCNLDDHMKELSYFQTVGLYSSLLIRIVNPLCHHLRQYQLFPVYKRKANHQHLPRVVVLLLVFSNQAVKSISLELRPILAHNQDIYINNPR